MEDRRIASTVSISSCVAGFLAAGCRMAENPDFMGVIKDGYSFFDNTIARAKSPSSLLDFSFAAVHAALFPEYSRITTTCC